MVRSIHFGGFQTTRLFFNDRWILSNFWYLNCYNFCYIFGKNTKLYFLEVSHRSLKTHQKSYPESPPLQRNGFLKIWKFYLLWCLLFQKRKELTFWIFYQANISINVYHFWKFDIQITAEGSKISNTVQSDLTFIFNVFSEYVIHFVSNAVS